MAANRMIVTGEKESFIARVLIKKVQDTGTECTFVPCTIDDLNPFMDCTSLITLCIGDEERPKEDVLHFLTESMEDYDLQMMVVGEQPDIEYICEHIPGSLIYATFARPVDNVKFAQTVTEYMNKMQAGDFKKSILIVDDDPSYLKLVREWLKDTYKVAMANSGMQAIKWLTKNKVDLILLDHEMPITSGPKVLEMLRSEAETQTIPVIFLTGKSDKDSVMAVVSLRPEGYFLKTIKKEELLQKLNEFFILRK